MTARQRFNSFSALARAKTEGEHYAVTVHDVGCGVAIVAPHGGRIEPGTAEMAKDIAGNDHSLYVFEGRESRDAFFELHVASAQFDDPRCVALVKKSHTTVTIHGCKGDAPVVYIGGRDKKLAAKLTETFNKSGIKAMADNHPFPATSPDNICNKNARGQGVQLEFSRGLRDDPALRHLAVKIVRKSFLPFQKMR